MECTQLDCKSLCIQIKGGLEVSLMLYKPNTSLNLPKDGQTEGPQQ